MCLFPFVSGFLQSRPSGSDAQPAICQPSSSRPQSRQGAGRRRGPTETSKFPPPEFDEVAAELGRTLDSLRSPEVQEGRSPGSLFPQGRGHCRSHGAKQPSLPSLRQVEKAVCPTSASVRSPETTAAARETTRAPRGNGLFPRNQIFAQGLMMGQSTRVSWHRLASLLHHPRPRMDAIA